MALAILVPLLTTLGEAVVNRYVSSDSAKRLAGTVFDALNEGAAAEARLTALKDEMVAKIEEAKAAGTEWAPSQSEIDVIWAEINARDDRWDAV